MANINLDETRKLFFIFLLIFIYIKKYKIRYSGG